MTTFLLNLFVPGASGENPDPDRSAVGTLSGGVGITVNFLLFLGKLLAGILSGSVSIVADAMNNLTDASGSVLTLIGFRLAGKPADAEHPYGHARFEYLSALGVSAMILLIGVELGKTSIEKILHPQPVTLTLLTGGILLASVGAKLWLCRFNRNLGRLIGSRALEATAMDSRNDCIATVAVLAAGIIEAAFDLRVDGIMGLCVAAFILRSGWILARQTISPLLGEGADPELRQKILSFLQETPNVLGVHDLLVHDYGPGRQFATVHVEMDWREDPLYCHELIDDMERECRHAYGVHLVIHYDPVVTDDPETEKCRSRVLEILGSFDERITIHDFRMIRGGRNANLIFDISLPGELNSRQEQIREYLQKELNEDPAMYYHLVLTFDMAQPE